MDCCDDSPSGGCPNGATEEIKFTENKSYAGAKDGAFTGNDGFVNLSFFSGSGQASVVVIADRAVNRWAVPGYVGARIKNFID